ncbi:hypothetical protein LCGC14_3162910 [marine sediment metagenome]|uniref:Uncharacterized protein n=1 Tax=marine sediment metagenome TaxID=412755 RepID=A0A0F8YF42_9ZZZZ
MKIFGLNKTDGATGALETIEVPHFELHEGNAFICDGNDTAMGDGDTLILAFKTADTTRWVHLTLTGWSLAQSHIDVIENCSWTTNTGTKQPLYNHNRNSSLTSNILEDSTGTFGANNGMVLNPTGLSGGTIIHHFDMGSGKKEEGQLDRGQAEFVLKQNETYAIRQTADAASNEGHIALNWYEHTSIA